MNKVKKLVYTLAVMIFTLIAFSSCSKDQDIADLSKALESPVISTSKTRASEWFSYPVWEATVITGKSFFVKYGHKVLVTVVNQGQVATQIMVKQKWTSIPDDVVTVFPSHVNSIIIDSSASEYIHVSVLSGESDGSFVGAKAFIYVSYLK